MPESAVFKKLNLKDQAEIVVLNAPASFESEMGKLDGVAIKTGEKDLAKASFALAFATKKAEIARLAKAIAKMPAGDVVVWVAYPKKSSKRYQSDLSGDWSWPAPFGALGYEPVRMVAIDEDWTASRFSAGDCAGVSPRSRRVSSEGR
jgi:hypothetical protein